MQGIALLALPAAQKLCPQLQPTFFALTPAAVQARYAAGTRDILERFFEGRKLVRAVMPWCSAC